jgi:DNA modification methylase
LTASPVRIMVGDCRRSLASLPPASVHCVVTSPPYFGLRDYGTATWDGGDPACEHVGREKPRNDTTGSGEGNGRFATTRGEQPGKSAYVEPVREVCRCGARRIDEQIGLERTPAEFVASLVDVFRSVWPVLRDDGTLWLNLGDSYARPAAKGGSGAGGKNEKYLGDNYGRARADVPPDLKPKDLIGIPWRVAFALQADGWYLRSDNIWHKPNPMPESVTDRPTKSHEYMFLLAKSERYYYDGAAIAEPAIYADSGRESVARGGFDGKGKDFTGREPFRAITETRNKRTVWTVPTQPYTGAHFATFPPALIEPCILAGSPRGGSCWIRSAAPARPGL